VKVKLREIPEFIKLIEARKILAEKFLEVLLSSQEVRNSPQKVLTFLDLPLNFYELSEIQSSD
jgi:hypothetical protein